jgi:ABC-type antimicrobial peptide transport system permease subunit
LIFNLVKSLLIVISVLILFSLLLISVQSKTFEIAVIRMVGLKKEGVIALILCQSFMYVIPALTLAFIVCLIALRYLSIIFY